MSIFNDKITKNVADVAAKIMNTKPVVEDKKQNLEVLDEKVGDWIYKTDWNGPGKGRQSTELSPEEHINAANWHSNKISELKSGKVSVYGKLLSRREIEDKMDYHKKMLNMHWDMGRPNIPMSDEDSKRVKDVISKIKQKKHDDAFSNHELPLRDYRQVAKESKESFSDLISIYKNKGFKGLNETIIEEVDNETFTKEIKDQQENSEGKKKKKIANAADMSVVIQKEESLEEKELTPEEKAKKEKIVMSMKKNFGDFKKRYGDKAKEVMYATATDKAKED